MKTLAIEVENGDIPTIRQALKNLVEACYHETSSDGRWKNSNGPERCGLCNAAKADPAKPHRSDCEVGIAEKVIVATTGPR